MTKEQARTIISGLVAQGLDVSKLTMEGRAEIGRALDVVIELANRDEWRAIETAPLGDDDFYLVCSDDPLDDRSPFVVRGSIFASARKHPPHHHLSLAYLTHWMPLPAKPRRT